MLLILVYHFLQYVGEISLKASVFRYAGCII